MGSVQFKRSPAHVSRAVVVLLSFVAALCGALVLGACSGGTGSVPGHDAGAGPAPGVLRVLITGLPERQSAFVVISAPGVERKLTTSADVPLAPGDYTVFAAAVTDADKTDGTGFAPDEESQPVTVTADAGATVDIPYALVTPQIAPETHVAGPETAASLASLTRDAEDGATLVFAHPTAETTGWKVGDLVVFGDTPTTPDGFFGRVATTDGTTVTTTAASLQEMIQQGVIDYTKSFSPSDIVKVTALDSGLAGDVRICNSLTASLPAKKGATSVALTVGGDICFTPTIKLKAHFSLTHLPDIYFDVGAGMTGSLDVTGAATIAIDDAVPILDVSLATFDIQLGPIPLVIKPEISISVGASGEVTASVTAGITSAVDAYGGFSFNGKHKRFDAFSGHSESFGFQQPTPQATATLRGYGGPQLTLLIYGLAGPFINLEGYTQLDVDLLNSPLHGGFDLNAGISSTKLLKLEYSVQLFEYDKVLATAPDPPPFGSRVALVTSSPSATNLAVDPSDTLYVATGDDVRALTPEGATAWTYTGTGVMEHVARAADGTLFAADFNGGVYALTSAGTEKWTTTLTPQVRGIATPAANLLYVSTGNAVASMNTANGNVVWSTDLGDAPLSISVGKDGTIYAPTGSGLVALAPSGSVKWTAASAQAEEGGAAIADDGTIYTQVNDGALAAVRPDGSLKWKRTVLTSDQPSGPVVGADGSIYLCGTDPGAALVALEPTSGDTKWRYALSDSCKGPPAMGADGNLYLATADNLRVLRASDGKLLWHASIPGGVGAPTGSPLFLSSKNVVAVNTGGLGIYYAGTTLATNGWPRDGYDGAAAGAKK